MIEIQERCLCAFEQDVAIGLEHVVNQVDRVSHVAFESRGALADVRLDEFIYVVAKLVVDLGQQWVLLVQHNFELGSED